MFTWDLEKAKINFGKHGVSFVEAATVFADTRGLDWEDFEHSGKERRLKRLGVSIECRIVIVVYTSRRTPDGKKAIRIISARQASRKERKAYSR